MTMKQAYFLVFACLMYHVQSANNSFIATNEWQTIEEGVEVPAGLHIRMNLKTGKKEAKLIQAEDEGGGKSALLPLEKENPEINPDELKEMLKNIKNEVPDSDNSRSKSFRSYDTIKKEFAETNMKIRTEAEIIHNLLEEYRSIRNKTVTLEEPEARLTTILEDLDFLVHQYDNAYDFTTMGGYSEIILPCLNNTYSDGMALKNVMLRLMGSAAQGNPRVQRAAVDAGAIPLLLRILASEGDTQARARAIFALSSILRQFPVAQASFLKQGGLSVIADVFDDFKHPEWRIRFKIINLVTDLLREMRDSLYSEKHIEAAYEPVVSLFHTREGGWCTRLAKWFVTVTTDVKELDHSMVEATASLLVELATEDCGDDLRIDLSLVRAVNLTKHIYGDLVLQEQDDGYSESYVADVWRILQHLAAILAQTTKYKEEL